MAVTTSNLVLGSATLYYGLVGATEPVDAVAAPASGIWTPLGATDGGVKLIVNQTFTDLSVDQVVDTPEARLTKRGFTIETTLAELTLANLQFAINGGTLNTAGSVSTFTPNTGLTNNAPLYHSLIVDGVAPNGKPRRVIVRKALSTKDVDFEYKKNGQAMYKVSLTAFYVSDTILPFTLIDGV